MSTPVTILVLAMLVSSVKAGFFADYSRLLRVPTYGAVLEDFLKPAEYHLPNYGRYNAEAIKDKILDEGLSNLANDYQTYQTKAASVCYKIGSVWNITRRSMSVHITSPNGLRAGDDYYGPVPLNDKKVVRVVCYLGSLVFNVVLVYKGSRRSSLPNFYVLESPEYNVVDFIAANNLQDNQPFDVLRIQNVYNIWKQNDTLRGAIANQYPRNAGPFVGVNEVFQTNLRGFLIRA